MTKRPFLIPSHLFYQRTIGFIMLLFRLQSMKVACTYFQCAAGAFQYLKVHFMNLGISLTVAI